MRIFIIHCRYQNKGGEDVVFASEFDLLKEKDEICQYVIQNKRGYKGLLQFLFMICNIYQTSKIKQKIKLFKPDLVHIHNLHFAIGPWLIRRIKRKMKLPIVMTLHNFRLLCPSATFIINDKLDTCSLRDSFPYRAIWKRAYHNSFLLTFWLAFTNWFHGIIGTWNLIDRYITLNSFSKSLFLENKLSISKEKFVVKANAIEDFGVSIVERNNRFLFVGRLSEEKGILFIIQLAKKMGFFLEIIGDGPLGQVIKDEVLTCENIYFRGAQEKEIVIKTMKCCTALIFPSIWFEGMPITILEAFSTGTPVIASNLGAMANMIVDGENGLLVTVNDKVEWESKISQWINLSNIEKLKFSESARKSYVLNYNLETNRKNLLEIYNSVLGTIK